MSSRSKLFTGFGKKYWKNGTILEIFKFSLYLSIPVLTSVFYANPEFMHKLNLNFVNYPKSDPPPPDADGIEKLRLKYKVNNNNSNLEISK